MISVGRYVNAEDYKRENFIFEYTQDLKSALLKGDTPEAYVSWFRDCPEKMVDSLRKAKEQMLPCLEIWRRLEKAGEIQRYKVDETPTALLLVQHNSHSWWIGGTRGPVPYELLTYIRCYAESRWPTYSHA